jgi:hypothetical protein
MIIYCPTAMCSCVCRVFLAIFEMAYIHEQHIEIKFYFKLGKTFMENHEMMKNVHGDQCMSCTRCYEWFKRLKDGRSQHMMSHIWDAHQRCVTMFMLHKFVKLCALIVV